MSKIILAGNYISSTEFLLGNWGHLQLLNGESGADRNEIEVQS